MVHIIFLVLGLIETFLNVRLNSSIIQMYAKMTYKFDF